MHYFCCGTQIALVAFLILFEPIQGNNWEPCGDWIRYNNEKCFKILDDTLRTFDEAKDVCRAEEKTSTLPVIRSAEEQQFLSNYLFKTEQKMRNFWIGAQYSSQNGSFVWIDNSPLNYTNWDAAQGPQSLADQCVYMQARVAVIGKLSDGSCGKQNAVVCQKSQFWSTEFLKKKYLDSRKQQSGTIRNLTQNLASSNQRIASQKESLQNAYQRIDAHKLNVENINQRFDELKQRLESANARITEQKLSLESANLKINEQAQNFIPIGFLYTQLPNEKDPTQIWPSMVWTDVSSQFAGVFFRVSGGDAEPFGQVQGSTSPRLSTVEYLRTRGDDKLHLASGQCQTVRTAGYIGAWRSLKFCMSSGEVRPRNMAVHIWKRTG